MPDRSDWKTMLRPSGENRASVSLPGPVVSGSGAAAATAASRTAAARAARH
ncbi:MAG: hypothetical protein ACKJSG_03955 [Lentisphaeria bacterium]